MVAITVITVLTIVSIVTILTLITTSVAIISMLISTRIITITTCSCSGKASKKFGKAGLQIKAAGLFMRGYRQRCAERWILKIHV